MAPFCIGIKWNMLPQKHYAALFIASGVHAPNPRCVKKDYSAIAQNIMPLTQMNGT